MATGRQPIRLVLIAEKLRYLRDSAGPGRVGCECGLARWRGLSAVSLAMVSRLRRGLWAQAVRSAVVAAQGRNRVRASPVGAVPPAWAH